MFGTGSVCDIPNKMICQCSDNVLIRLYYVPCTEILYFPHRYNFFTVPKRDKVNSIPITTQEIEVYYSQQ